MNYPKIIIFGTIFLSCMSAFFVHFMLSPNRVNELNDYTPPTPTQIYDSKERLIHQFYLEKREYTPYEDIPINLIISTLSVEDEQFFNHFGFNPWRILQALFIDLINLKKLQGASTITLQLSKVLFLSYEKTFTRKIRELFYGLQIERFFTKKEILHFYFNQINYGNKIFGVGSASKEYFQKDIKYINYGESTILASLPKAPNYYSPKKNPKNAYSRQRIVLNSMIKKNIITQQEANDIQRNFWSNYTPKNNNKINNKIAPHFIEYIRRKLERSKDVGKTALYEGGLKIHTTLNLDHQVVAQKYMNETLKNKDKIFEKKEKRINAYLYKNLYKQLQTLSSLFNIPNIGLNKIINHEKIYKQLSDDYIKEIKNLSLLTGNKAIFSKFNKLAIEREKNKNLDTTQGAFISIEPKTGYITSLVGGSKFDYNNQLNYVFQAQRQVGSTIKPFFYAVAIKNKLITASTLFNDIPVGFGSGENIYYPKNYGNRFHGLITARKALAKSINTVAVKVLNLTTIPVTREFLINIFNINSSKFIDQKFPPNLTLALGTGTLSPYEMASAYTILANDGKRITPYATRFITNRKGKIIYNPMESINSSIKQVMDPGTSFIISNILIDDFKPGGTAYKPSLLKNFKQVHHSAGKTGTSSNWTDAWFAGYNKNLVAVVWFGRQGNRSLGIRRSGGAIASPVWIKFMSDVLKNEPIIPFKEPTSITTKIVSKKTGQLVKNISPDSYKEYFLLGTSPIMFDDNQKQTQNKKYFLKRLKNKLFLQNKSISYIKRLQIIRNNKN